MHSVRYKSASIVRSGIKIHTRSFARRSNPSKGIRRSSKEAKPTFLAKKYEKTPEAKLREEVTTDVNTSKTDFADDILRLRAKYAVMNPDGTLNGDETNRCVLYFQSISLLLTFRACSSQCNTI